MAKSHNLISWMAQNHVAANMLMLALIVGGLLGLHVIRQEITPDFTLDGIEISISYPGASPEEIEDSVILAVENALQIVDGIDTVSSNATEGVATVTAELVDGVSSEQVLQDIRSAVSRITSFPEEAEPANISIRQHGFYVISIGVAGDLSAFDLWELSERIRFALLNISGVSQVDVRGRRAPQLNIEISQYQLQALDLTLAEVAASIQQVAKDIPAGNMKTIDGEILLRTQGRREYANEYADIPIKTTADGAQIKLADIATITDGFDEQQLVFAFNGQPGMRLDIYQSVHQNPIELAQKIKTYIANMNQRLPKGTVIRINNDRSVRYAERQAILLKNGAFGLILVVICLGAFLNLRLAFWVAVSIPVVFIGSFTLLPSIGVTLNMISMFAFILTLGIVVDDAIIVGENIYRKIESGIATKQAVVDGVNEMLVPVSFAVLTNILAFIPLLYVPGASGQFLRSLPMVACVVFFISLIEALLILPSHLNHKQGRVFDWNERIMQSFDHLRDRIFVPALHIVLRERYITTLVFIGLLGIMIAWYYSGRIDLSWRPEIPGNRVDAEVEMPSDASVEDTLAIIHRVEAAGLRAIERLGGQQYLDSWFIRAGWRRATYGDVNMYLVADQQRPFTQAEFTRLWREEIGDLPEVKSIFFEYLVGPGGNRSLRVNLAHSSTRVLEAAAKQLAQSLSSLKGVVDVSDGIGEGKRQISFSLTSEAKALGITETQLGQQLRHAFYGAEALRFLRQGNEIKVMVRLPANERDSLQSLQTLLIRAADGTKIPLLKAANLQMGNAYSTIQREDGQRYIRVVASIDKALANSRQVRAKLEKTVLPELQAQFPNVSWSFAGSRRDRNAAMNAIFSGLAWVILIIYAALSALFRNYAQSLVVMLTIPFAVAAAIAGHILLGFDLSSVSIFGMIALCGLVINSSLVLTVRLNQIRQDYDNGYLAIVEATRSRFRPILLTALTTTAGLFPILFETSIQAQFLVPMAIALSFGTVASMFVVLLLIPALYAIGDDFQSRF